MQGPCATLCQIPASIIKSLVADCDQAQGQVWSRSQDLKLNYLELSRSETGRYNYRSVWILFALLFVFCHNVCSLPHLGPFIAPGACLEERGFNHERVEYWVSHERQKRRWSVRVIFQRRTSVGGCHWPPRLAERRDAVVRCKALLFGEAPPGFTSH